MSHYEITYPSVNSEFFTKPITALVTEPGRVDENTGALILSHGWGGNRLDMKEMMNFAGEEFNLVCLSVEYRQSGFDFDPVKGIGAYVPYDASFFQVFDVLNGLRKVLDLHPGLNRKRLFHYGGSQGGHIALLSAIFAPHTFAFVHSACPVTHMDPNIQKWAGREFAPYELAVRNVIEHAEFIQCPLSLTHGTADSTIPDTHTRQLEARLVALEKKFTVYYYEGGEHNLEPVTTRFESFKAIAPAPLKTLTLSGRDDFAAGTIVEIPCKEKTLHIDWSKPAASPELFHWT
jgi:predicted esterase